MKMKYVGVVGAGRSGLAAAARLRRMGVRVLLSESGTVSGRIPRGIDVESGGHTDRLLETDLIIRSPGIPDHLPVLKKARQKGIPVWSELEFASRSIDPRHLIAITGTNGKTTTTTLAGELFKAAGRPTLVGGNIGTPLSDLVGRIKRRTTVVLEVSSYQLENIERFHPTIAAILNITPDHLEHHGTLRAYVAAKARIFENQTARDVCVLNADDRRCRGLAARCPGRVFLFSRRKRLPQGIYYEDGDIVVRWGKISERWGLNWNLPGAHNIENALAAAAVALAGSVPVRVIRRVLEKFRGVEHRLETVRMLGGARYVNDSKATNVDSTRVALESFSEPLIMIMGGRGKGTPYTSLRALIKRHARHLLLIGEDAARIRRDLGSATTYEILGAMPQAVARARQIAREGDVVLLSPACASFDQYRNYEERGRHFKALVRKLR